MKHDQKILKDFHKRVHEQLLPFVVFYNKKRSYDSFRHKINISHP